MMIGLLSAGVVNAAEVCNVSAISGQFIDMHCTGSTVAIKKDTNLINTVKQMVEAGYDLKIVKSDAAWEYSIFVKP